MHLESLIQYPILVCQDGFFSQEYTTDDWGDYPTYTDTDTYTDTETTPSDGCYHGGSFQEDCVGQPCDDEGEPRGPIWLEFQVLISRFKYQTH